MFFVYFAWINSIYIVFYHQNNLFITTYFNVCMYFFKLKKLIKTEVENKITIFAIGIFFVRSIVTMGGLIVLKNTLYTLTRTALKSVVRTVRRYKWSTEQHELRCLATFCIERVRHLWTNLWKIWTHWKNTTRAWKARKIYESSKGKFEDQFLFINWISYFNNIVFLSRFSLKQNSVGRYILPLI